MLRVPTRVTVEERNNRETAMNKEKSTVSMHTMFRLLTRIADETDAVQEPIATTFSAGFLFRSTQERDKCSNAAKNSNGGHPNCHDSFRRIGCIGRINAESMKTANAVLTFGVVGADDSGIFESMFAYAIA